MEMRQVIEKVFIDPDLEGYIVSLIAKTRTHRLVNVGASPRGGLALLKLARASAAMQGRDYVLPDDIKAFAQAALAHRVILEPGLWTVRDASEKVIDEVVHSVNVPVLSESGA